MSIEKIIDSSDIKLELKKFDLKKNSLLTFRIQNAETLSESDLRVIIDGIYQGIDDSGVDVGGVLILGENIQINELDEKMMNSMGWYKRKDASDLIDNLY